MLILPCRMPCRTTKKMLSRDSHPQRRTQSRFGIIFYNYLSSDAYHPFSNALSNNEKNVESRLHTSTMNAVILRDLFLTFCLRMLILSCRMPCRTQHRRTRSPNACSRHPTTDQFNGHTTTRASPKQTNSLPVVSKPIVAF